MMRILTLAFVLLLFAVGCSSSGQGGEDGIVQGTGTVQYVEVEGGFYGIVRDDGRQFDPVNLDESFKEDGLRVHFRARVQEETIGIHMWGTIVEIISIERI